MASLIPSMPVSFMLRISGCVAVARGVARVHPQQLRREQGGLVATRAGPDLEDDVAIVVRVARQEQHLELLDEARLARAPAGRSPRAPWPASRRRRRRRRRARARRPAPRGSPRAGGRPRRWARAGRAPCRAGGSGSGRRWSRVATSSAWRSSYWSAISASVASRSLMSAVAARPGWRRPTASAGGSGSSGAACRAPSARDRSRSSPPGSRCRRRRAPPPWR